MPDSPEVSSQPAVETLLSKFQLVQIAQVKPARHQARKSFNEDSLKGLAESMTQEGLQQPITVRQIGDDYELVSGERRLRAAKLLGWPTIEAKVIKTASEAEAAAKGLIENLQREDLNPIEEAQGFQELNKLDPAYWTQEKIAGIFGKKQSYVSESLSLIGLPDSIKENICRQIFSRSLGVELARLNGQEAQLVAANAIEGLNRDEARKILHVLKGNTPSKMKAKKEPVDGFQFKTEGDRLVIHGRTPIVKSQDAAQQLADLIKDAFSSWVNGQKQPDDMENKTPPTMPEIPEAVQQAMPSNEAEFKQMEEDQKNLRLPKNDQEQAELEALASQGPAAVYAWIFGPTSLMAKKMANVTWADMNITDSVTSCRQLVEGIHKSIR
jgi:ParB family transcriptional regulator, chromosome partitioning protein